MFTSILLGVSILAALGIAEVLLRVIPIPGISFHTFYYDELTGGRYYPGTTQTYRNARNDYVRREVNSWGYLDVDHTVENRPGSVRFGFFGDSYTQAAQVPIEQTFFRLIEANLNAGGPEKGIECLAFGVSGFRTLQSYLESRRWMNKIDLDWGVYVFSENDIGDQIK